MSLRYLLFNIPFSEEEVVYRAKKTGEVPEILVTREMINRLDPIYRPFKCAIKLKVGRVGVMVEQWKKSFPNFVKGIDDDRADFVAVEDYAAQRAESIA